MLVSDGVISSFLEIGLSTCSAFALISSGNLGIIRFWEVNNLSGKKMRYLAQPICLKAEARTEYLGAFPSV